MPLPRPPAAAAATASALTLALALTLAGCSGGGSGGDAAEPGASPSTSTSTSTKDAETTVKQPDVDVPTQVPNRPRKRDRVRLTTCAATDGGWSASGTARAGKAGSERYRITVFFTTDRATVVGWGRTTVEAAAGQSVEWSVSADLPVEGDLLCVLRGVG